MFLFPSLVRAVSRRSCLPLLLLLGVLARPGDTRAHGSLESGRMLQVRLAGPSGHTPAPWNDSYYTWNQNSQNFPNYAATGFKYSTTVPNGTLASAGINDGVQSGLNFTGLNNPGAGWQATAVAAGNAVTLHWLATATHEPSHFLVYLTRPGVNADTTVISWENLEYLGSWAIGNATRPVNVTTRPNPVVGGTMPSYNWDVTIPADRSGHVALYVIWQRDDPAGEAFFAVQDFQVSAAANPAPVLAATASDGSVALDLRGTPGQSYDLQAADDLASPSWQTVATGTADNQGRLLASDPITPERPRRFYRAVVRP